MSYGPAGGGGSEPEPRLQREIIHLVDHAIYVIAQIRAGQFNCAIMADQLFGSVTGYKQRIDGKPQSLQPRHCLGLAGS